MACQTIDLDNLKGRITTLVNKRRFYISRVWSFILILQILALPAAVHAQFIWQTNSDGVTLVITGYTGPGGDVIIPSQINGLTVTAVAGDGFYQCTNLTGITIPRTVTTISSFGEAFAGCVNLKSAVMLPGVADIGPFSFSGCTSLTNVAIPNSVTNIDASAFNGCYSLTNVVFPVGLISIGGAAADQLPRPLLPRRSTMKGAS